MRVPRARAVTYLVLALALGAAAWGIGVGSLLGQRTEAVILESAHFSYTPPPPLGLVSTPLAVSVLLVISLLAWWVHGLARALIIILSVGIGVVASQLLKQQVLVRPELFEYNATNTFPSGHMTLFMALSGALIWAVPRGIRGLVAAAMIVLCSVVSWQLLHYGWHRPSDILGGVALGLASFALCAVLIPTPSKRAQRSSARGTAVFSRLFDIAILLVSCIVLLFGLVMVAIAGWIGATELLVLGAQWSLMGATGLTLRATQALVFA